MKDLVEMGEAKVQKISGLMNRSDGMTKVLLRVKHEEFARAMCVMPPEVMRKCAEDKETRTWYIQHDWIGQECQGK